MRTKTSQNILTATNAQKVLSFLVEHPHEEMTALDVEKAVGLSKAGAYRALDLLSRQDLVLKRQQGRFTFYEVNPQDSFVRQFKVLKRIQQLAPLLKKLKALTRKVTLFGSASRGEDTSDSDVDLFIETADPDKVRNIINSTRSKQRIQPVIKTSVELADMEVTDAVFLNEVAGGIVVWEAR